MIGKTIEMITDLMHRRYGATELASIATCIVLIGSILDLVRGESLARNYLVSDSSFDTTINSLETIATLTDDYLAPFIVLSLLVSIIFAIKDNALAHPDEPLSGPANYLVGLSMQLTFILMPINAAAHFLIADFYQQFNGMLSTACYISSNALTLFALILWTAEIIRKEH